MTPPPESDVDPRWSLANERTFLAWTRTCLALLLGGVAAAKVADFNHELVRWIVAAPPLVGGSVLAGGMLARWRSYEAAMRERRPLPTGRHLAWLACGLAGYGLVVLVALILDG